MRTRRVARLGTIALIGALFSILAATAGRASDNRAYCAPDGKVVVFLVDVTTPYDETDKKAIVRLTDDIFSSLKGGERFVVRTIAHSHTHSEWLADHCIPHCPAEGTLDRWFKCSDGRIKTDHRVVREETIGSLRKRLATFEELPYSDIVRTIHTVANETVSGNRQLSMYVYSDLIENSNYFASRYLFTYPLSRLIYGLQHYKLIANLKDAEIRVIGVGRAGTRDRRPLTVVELNKLTEFWNAYFKESGAKSISITPDVVAPRSGTIGQR
jgi:hypothetical protein